MRYFFLRAMELIVQRDVALKFVNEGKIAAENWEAVLNVLGLQIENLEATLELSPLLKFTCDQLNVTLGRLVRLFVIQYLQAPPAWWTNAASVAIITVKSLFYSLLFTLPSSVSCRPSARGCYTH